MSEGSSTSATYVPRTLLEHKMYFSTFTLLAMLQLCPIWLTNYPPMHDYPNHLARAHIEHYYSEVKSYQNTYEQDWEPVPNLAIDFIIPPLLHIVSVETASKIFLSLIVVMFNLGLHRIGVATAGQPHWAALTATFFTFNYAFAYGFVNYMFGLGLFFLTLATWIQARSAWDMPRVLSMILLAFLCYFSHLSSFVFLSVAVAGLTIQHVAKSRTVRTHDVIGVLPLLPVTFVYLLYTMGIRQGAAVEWPTEFITKKLTGLLYPFVSYNIPVELFLSLAFVIIVLTVLISRGGQVNWDVFIVGCVFVGLYLIAPFSAAESHYVDRRFIIPAAVMFVLALSLDTARAMGRYMVIGLVVLSIGRVATVWHSWTNISREIETQVHMMDLLPTEPRVYPMLMVVDRGPAEWLSDMHFYFALHYATIYRHAFVPGIYAWKSVNPIHLRTTEPDNTRIPPDMSLEQVDWNKLMSEYDYVWGYRLTEPFKRHLLHTGQMLAQHDKVSLFKLNKP